MTEPFIYYGSDPNGTGGITHLRIPDTNEGYRIPDPIKEWGGHTLDWCVIPGPECIRENDQ